MKLAWAIITALVAVALLTAAASVGAEPELRWLSRVEVARSPDESPEARRARLVAAERAILDAAGNDVELVAALVVYGTEESHWARYVAEGRCLEGRWKCDVDRRTGRPRAASYWQLWAGACPAIHRGPGAPDVRVAAACAARLLRWGRARCNHWAGAFSVLRGDGRCDHAFGRARAAKMARLLGRGGDA